MQVWLCTESRCRSDHGRPEEGFEPNNGCPNPNVRVLADGIFSHCNRNVEEADSPCADASGTRMTRWKMTRLCRFRVGMSPEHLQQKQNEFGGVQSNALDFTAWKVFWLEHRLHPNRLSEKVMCLLLSFILQLLGFWSSVAGSVLFVFFDRSYWMVSHDQHIMPCPSAVSPDSHTFAGVSTQRFTAATGSRTRA
jgi:hypothetical protein